MSKEKEKKKSAIQKILDDELEVVRNGVSGGFISGDLEAVDRIYEEVCKDEQT